MVITLCNGKGGSGKTTLTMLLAAALIEAGHDVAVQDLDPQRTATRWVRASCATGSTRKDCPIVARLATQTLAVRTHRMLDREGRATCRSDVMVRTVMPTAVPIPEGVAVGWWVVLAALVIAVFLAEPFMARHDAGYVREWLARDGYRVERIRRTWSSGAFGAYRRGNLRTFTEGRGCRYFDVVAVNERFVEFTGTARVHGKLQRPNLDEWIEVRWDTRRQLSPPQKTVTGDENPSNAEGWYPDVSGRHEQRWYSMGTPTELVRDGAVEGKDPPTEA